MTTDQALSMGSVVQGTTAQLGAQEVRTRPEPDARAGARASAGTTRHRISSLLILSDITALVIACLLASAIRLHLPMLEFQAGLISQIAVCSLVICALWLLSILLFGGYSARLLSSGPEMYRSVLQASMAAVGIVGAVLFLTDLRISRPYFVALFVIGTLMVVLVRFAGRQVLNRARARGRMRSRVLVVGSAGHVRGITRTLNREVWLGYDVMGAVTPIHEAGGHEDTGIPVLGDESQLLSLVRSEAPEVVLFTAGSSASAEEFRRIAWELEDQDVDVIVVPAVSEISGDRISMRPVAGLPLVHMDLPRARRALKRTKRVFDIVASSMILLLISPILALVALGVKLNDGGPVIFRQQRVGRGGEHFEFLKFRSMVPDAEARKKALLEQERDRGNDVLFKLADDPRITRIGKVLRRYSLDELPQLWNVLRGDMSLVGPRPALPDEVSAYEQDAHRRLAVRPGITGLWQVSGRSDLAWDDTVRLDLFYVDNWSFTQDMLILARTARAVVASQGAY